MAKQRAWLGIRPIDIGITAAVAAAVELNVAVSAGPRQVPLNALTYIVYGLIAVPIAFRRRWPLQVLIACSVLLMICYSVHRRDISPVPLLTFPLYDAATAGYLAWAIVIPAVYMTIGLVLAATTTREGLAGIAADFLPSIALLAVAIVLGDTVRSRRALAAETAERLRLAREERAAEAARLVAEERLRIARELHDSVAHAMATITVQAGSALHRIGAAGREGTVVQDALTAIRQTSKTVLADMRVTLHALRGTDSEAGQNVLAGLDQLDSLVNSVRAAGAPVAVTVEGCRPVLPPQVDHAAYRILQESLTNVLKHAGQSARATVGVRYAKDEVTIRVTDDGAAQPEPTSGGGHGLTGMRERAAAVGGDVAAGPREGGGFEVTARLPVGTRDAARRMADEPR